MKRAIFAATDERNRTDAELEPLLSALHGVWRWEAGPNGQALIEYDEQLVSVETIEEGLAGLGFQVQHLYDEEEQAVKWERRQIDDGSTTGKPNPEHP